MKYFGKLVSVIVTLLMIVSVFSTNEVNAAVKLNVTNKTLIEGSKFTLKLQGTSKKGKAKSSSKAVSVTNVKKTKTVKVRKRVVVKVKVRGKWKKRKVWRKVKTKKKVTVKNSFNVKAVKQGKADITVTYGKKKAVCHVTVNKKVVTFYNAGHLNTVVGYTYNLAKRLYHTSDSKYYTSNESVALVDEDNGLLMPIHNGNCTIYRKVNGGLKAQISISVKSSSDVKIGVDVSRHNGNVNFKTLKSHHIDFAIIRGGNGCKKYNTTDNQSIDLNLKKNIDGAKAAGMKYGIYWYLNSSTNHNMSNADAKKQGDSLANRLLALGVNKNTRIYIDLEEKSALVKDTTSETSAFQKNMCKTFEAELRNKGYNNIGIYASTSWYKSYLKNDYFMNKVDVGEEGITSHWFANYNFASRESAKTPQFYYKDKLITPDIWQTGSKFRISGVDSHYVDMNYLYVK